MSWEKVCRDVIIVSMLRIVASMALRSFGVKARKIAPCSIYLVIKAVSPVQNRG